MPSPPQTIGHVACHLTFEVIDAAVLALQVAPASCAGEIIAEKLDVSAGGGVLRSPTIEIANEHCGRTHIVRAEAGSLDVDYSATISRPAAAPTTVGEAPPAIDATIVAALRQSRYCQSDALVGFATAELASLEQGPHLARDIASWVFERLAYEPGSSGPLDSAIDTLVANAGVCRDFVHLTIALCRALGVPARFVSVYAPGLSPMDFHAVVETRSGDRWQVVDPTRLAPRQSLIRIATGRDAADTAFVTTLSGEAELLWSDVMAVVEGDLPTDDHEVTVELP